MKESAGMKEKIEMIWLYYIMSKTKGIKKIIK